MRSDLRARDSAYDYVTDGGASEYEQFAMTRSLKYDENEAKKSWYDRALNLKESLGKPHRI